MVLNLRLAEMYFSMNRLKPKIKLGIDHWFLIASGILLVLIISISIFSIIFLGNHVFRGFSALDPEEKDIQFDLERYRALNLTE